MENSMYNIAQNLSFICALGPWINQVFVKAVRLFLLFISRVTNITFDNTK